MIVELDTPIGLVPFRLPSTAAEVLELRVFACSHSASEPDRFVLLAIQWLNRYAVEPQDWLQLELVDLGELSERLCLTSETPPTHQQDVWDRLLVLYGVQDERREDETGAFDGCLPWVSRAASMAFAVCEDAAALALPPWAYRLRGLVKEVEAVRRHDRKRKEAEVAETMRIAAALGSVPKFNR